MYKILLVCCGFSVKISLAVGLAEQGNSNLLIRNGKIFGQFLLTKTPPLRHMTPQPIQFPGTQVIPQYSGGWNTERIRNSNVSPLFCFPMAFCFPMVFHFEQNGGNFVQYHQKLEENGGHFVQKPVEIQTKWLPFGSNFQLLEWSGPQPQLLL